MNRVSNKINVKKVLPFKRCFLLIDKVLSYKTNKEITAQKYLTGKEWYIKGHFPDSPVMPGHLIAESMVQTCALFFGKKVKDKNRKFYLASSKTRFFKVVKPKERLVIKAYPVRRFSNAGIFKAEARVKNKLIAKGEFTIAVKR